jgi:hypothetical protein
MRRRNTERWTADDLVVGRAEARVLAFAVVSRLANEDVEREFYLEQLLRESSLSRGAAMTAVRRLVERRWLSERFEVEDLARFEARPARTYYEATPQATAVTRLLLGDQLDLHDPGGEAPRAKRAKRTPSRSR